MDAGLLILRIVVGMALIGHGTQKPFGWFGGHGRSGTGAFFELLGYHPGVIFAVIAGVSEAGAGALLAVGLLTPLAGAAVVEVMLNAAWSRRGRGPWVMNGGWEYTVVLATIGASMALTGPGSDEHGRARASRSCRSATLASVRDATDACRAVSVPGLWRGVGLAARASCGPCG